MIRVMVVDDQRLIRDVVKLKLESDGTIEVALEACTGEEARKLIEHTTVDVVLMDINMPGMGGVEATARLVRRWPHLKIVALSTFSKGPEPVRFLAAGGVGYVSKDDSAEDLIAAIRQAHNGGRYVSATVAGNIVVSENSESNLVFDELTEREIQILRHIAGGNEACNVAEQLHISVKTVHFHRQKLLQKLGVTNDVQLARLAWEAGLPSA